MSESIFNILDKYQSISLDEMNDVSLLKRTDTKFILPELQLPAILRDMGMHYQILEIKGRRVMNYKSLYFDTPENQFYYEHHNGKIKRTKIRIRQYVDSNLFFFEIKKKDGRSVTNKSRIPISDFKDISSVQLQDFILNVTGQEYHLEPLLWNRFQRMTLVSKKEKERATIDINLSYQFLGIQRQVPKLVIFELKQEKFNINSPIVQALKSYGVRPSGFSKYCIGRTLLHKDIKYNAFKPKLLKLNKISA